jgi:hypothetical protein
VANEDGDDGCAHAVYAFRNCVNGSTDLARFVLARFVKPNFYVVYSK